MILIHNRKFCYDWDRGPEVNFLYEIRAPRKLGSLKDNGLLYGMITVR